MNDVMAYLKRVISKGSQSKNKTNFVKVSPKLHCCHPKSCVLSKLDSWQFHVGSIELPKEMNVYFIVKYDQKSDWLRKHCTTQRNVAVKKIHDVVVQQRAFLVKKANEKKIKKAQEDGANKPGHYKPPVFHSKGFD